VNEDASARLQETTIASRTVFTGRLLRLRVDEVTLPGGGSSTREIVEHPGAVAAVALEGEDVLLVRQWRHPAGEVLLEIPAGTLEPGEEPEATVRRELVEEIGRRAGRVEHLMDFYVAPGYSSELIRLYLATELEAASGETDTDENIEVVRVPLAEAVARCRAGALRDGKTVTALLLAAARLT